MLALGALGAASGSAVADSSNVQVFGIVDVGVLMQSKTAGGNGSTTSVATSGLRQSVWGFKGTENIGNGNNVFFNLESHIDIDNGQLHGSGDAAGSSTPLFRRQANLGMSGDWGSVTVGRQYGPALLAHIGTEPRAFKEQFSNLYAWAYNQYAATATGAAGATNRNTNNDVGIFFSNSVQYRNTLGPVSFGVLYSLGEVAGDTAKNSAWAVGAAYNGPVTVSASYQQMKDQTSGITTVKHSGLGLAVPFTDGAVKLNYLNAKNYDGTTGNEVSNVDGIGIGVDYKWSPANTFTVAYYNNKDDVNKSDETHNWVFSNDYALSKRTTFYAQMALVDAKAGASLKTSIVAGGPFVYPAGEKTTLINIGLNHNF
ncbi:MAG: porin [Rhodocyclaceae bacterium]|nr:MAG: porin [Rhodocyclaceae bacterium]